MLRSWLISIVITASLSVTSCGASGPPVPSDGELSKRWETKCNSFVATIPTGDLLVQRPWNPNYRKKTISDAEYNFALAAQTLGLVKVERNVAWDNFLTGNGRVLASSDDYREAAAGIVARATVTLTEKGKELPLLPDPRFGEWRMTPQVTCSSVEIVSKEVKSDGTQTFLLYLGKYHVKPTPIFEAYLSLIGTSQESLRKFAVLEKWDQFESIWKDTGAWTASDLSRDLNLERIQQAMGGATTTP